MALWDSPAQREAYTWFTTELTNLRTAFRWAADRGDLDAAATIAMYAGWFGYLTENYEPIAWAEELIEPARAIDHPRLTALYVVASNCYMAGRIDLGIRYTEAAERAISGGSDHVVPYVAESAVGGAYVAVGQPERMIRWCRIQLARGRDADTLTKAALVVGLAVTGSTDDAMAAANGLIGAAEATGNPYMLSWALLAYGLAMRDADRVRSFAALRRGLAIAQDSGNRANQSHLALNLCFQAEHDEALAAFDYFTVAIGNYHDSGNTYMICSPLGLLAAFFDRLGRYEAAATIAGFAVTSPCTSGYGRVQHRDCSPSQCAR